MRTESDLRVEDAVGGRQQVAGLDERGRAERLLNGEELGDVDVQESHPRELIGPSRRAALNPEPGRAEAAALF